MNKQSREYIEINQLLAQIGEMLEALDTALDCENQAIRKRNTEDLISTTNAKIALLQSLEMSSHSLSGLMSQFGYKDEKTATNKGMLAFELGEIWTTFCERLEICQHKNTVNGRAIELGRVSTDRVINILRGNDRPVYGRAGKIQNTCEITTLAEA